MPISPHGMAIALVWFAAILALLALQPRLQDKLGERDRSPVRANAILSVALVVVYAVLRYQPIRMGGDPFAYSLGIFDAVTVFALVMLWWRPRRTLAS